VEVVKEMWGLQEKTRLRPSTGSGLRRGYPALECRIKKNPAFAVL